MNEHSGIKSDHISEVLKLHEKIDSIRKKNTPQEQDQPSDVSLIMPDMDEFVHSKCELCITKEKYQMLLENIGNVVFKLDHKGIIRYISALNKEIWGYDQDEIIGKYFPEITCHEDHERLMNRFLDHYHNYRNFDSHVVFRVINKHGAIKWARAATRPLIENGSFMGVIGILSDITDMKLIEEALKVSDDKFRHVFQTNPDAISITRLRDGTYVSINDGFTKLTGYEDSEIIGRSDADINIWANIEDRQHLIDMLKENEAIINFEVPFRRKDGGIKYGSISSVVITLDGEPHLIKVTRDITDRKLAEDALHRSEENYRRSIDDSPLGMRIVTRNGETIYTNHAILDIYEYDSINDFKTIPVEKRYTADSYAEHLVRKEKRRNGEEGPTEYTISIITKNNHIRYLHVFRKEILWDGQYQFLVTYNDITNQKRLEEERLDMERSLLHAQKLESIGLLTGGIAHDFNNLLMAILGNLELALGDISPVSKARPFIKNAAQASKRAADLTQQMLAYSGKGHFVTKALNLAELVEENIHIFKAGIPKSVTLNLQLKRDLPVIFADAGQVQQVVMNLITNAAESIIEENGSVTLSTGLAFCSDIDFEHSRITEKPNPGQFAYLEISDTGCGMDEETKKRLFDPFFTTKFTGRGLGMSAVLGIVRGHKGALFVDSEIGRGTTVKVLFPIWERRCFPRRPSNASSRPHHRANHKPAISDTILVVDDEVAILNLCKARLERLGYRVLMAADGKEAVDIFREHVLDIVCVILDLTMPRMDGLSAFRELRLINPKIKVILSSGYNEEEATKHFIDTGLAGFIQKPYELKDFRKELERVIRMPV
ncbi:MAG: Sensor histidine kinase RcsC [Syntrophus sp. SKADARSKE-3]|nr:Sensor histidine kinase RcsC [Syntrophus sp. SKADARSKE-3]